MRKFLMGLLTVGLALAIPAAHAQFFSGSGVGQTANIWAIQANVVGNNAIIGNTATNFVLPPNALATSSYINLDSQSHIFISIQAAGVYSNATFSASFALSPDGKSWDTTNDLLLSGTASTSGVVISTNFYVGGARYICPIAWTNTGSLSNVLAQYTYKPGY